MISAYTKEQISAIRHQLKAKKWLNAGVISEEQQAAIVDQHPSDLYQVKFAMAILLLIGGTIGIIGFEASFFVGMFSDLDDMLELPAIILAGIVLFMTEWLLIKERSHYRTGLLQAGYIHAIQLILAAVFLVADGQELVFAFFITFLCIFAALRYMDRFALASGYLGLSAFVFLLFESMEGTFVYFVPIILSALFAGIAYASNRLVKTGDYWEFGDLISASRVFALILAYLFINVLVVSTAAKEFMQMSGDLPLSWLFIALSIIVPVALGLEGWVKRDRTLLDIGAIGIGVSIYSIKIFFELPTNEFVMSLVGLALLIGAILLIRYFDKARDGVTSKNETGQESTLLKVLEAANAFERGEEKSNDLFGGGDFGGGGSQSNF
ncbi:hypothetical protein N8Z47_03645 [Salibacteraceae bacterium]|nr:hypothetical protein [Salibacteraceae bacterium]